MEFALILPILLMLVGGVIQYGAIFATKHALIQVGRDIGRWAATQNYNPCRDARLASPPQPLTEADVLAQQSHILGYTAGDWHASNFTVYPDNAAWPDMSAFPALPPNTEGIEVMWSYASGNSCPPANSSNVVFVTIRLTHRAPVLIPGLPYLPSLGTCDASGCYLAITTTSEFRMEPRL